MRWEWPFIERLTIENHDWSVIDKMDRVSRFEELFLFIVYKQKEEAEGLWVIHEWPQEEKGKVYEGVYVYCCYGY